MNIIQKHLASYGHAIRGIAHAFKHESAMRFHVAAMGGVILTNVLLQVTKTEWLITLVLTGLVLAAEVFNTAIERLADRVTREDDVLIGHAKDLASGAVGILCVLAVICGLIVYLPYIH